MLRTYRKSGSSLAQSKADQGFRIVSQPSFPEIRQGDPSDYRPGSLLACAGASRARPSRSIWPTMYWGEEKPASAVGTWARAADMSRRQDVWGSTSREEITELQHGRGRQQDQGCRRETKHDGEDQFHRCLVGPDLGRLATRNAEMLRLLRQRADQFRSQVAAAEEQGGQLVGLGKVHALGKIIQRPAQASQFRLPFQEHELLAHSG